MHTQQRLALTCFHEPLPYALNTERVTARKTAHRRLRADHGMAQLAAIAQVCYTYHHRACKRGLSQESIE
jgi:hypothetical protein